MQFTNGTADLRWTTHLSICAQMKRKDLYRSIRSTSPLTLMVLKRKKKDTKLQMHLQMSPAKNDAKYNLARFAFSLTDSQCCVQPNSNFKEKWVYVYIFLAKSVWENFPYKQNSISNLHNKRHSNHSNKKTLQYFWRMIFVNNILYNIFVWL